MKVLDLCCGLGGASRAFKDRGHEVTTLDNDPKFHPDLLMDVRDYHGIKGSFDVVLSGPPCTVFSVAGIWKYWHLIDDFKRRQLGVDIIYAVFKIIKDIEPKFYVIENPMGMLRKVIGMPTETIFYCSYGSPFKKPTDLWHNLPKRLRLPCAPHEKAPHGFGKGIAHVRNPDKRSEWPYNLSLAICKICEDDLMYPLKPMLKSVPRKPE